MNRFNQLWVRLQLRRMSTPMMQRQLRHQRRPQATRYRMTRCYAPFDERKMLFEYMDARTMLELRLHDLIKAGV